MESVKQQTLLSKNHRSIFSWSGNSYINHYGWRATSLLFENTAKGYLTLQRLSNFKDERTLHVLSKVQEAFQASTIISSIEMSMVRKTLQEQTHTRCYYVFVLTKHL
ncbi:hypothetical protein Ocin01_17972 [Orchesella cincta]|uniref:Uncharacterized protein n=1 Tax=Orchesella cincta TaxID=48709 RepID=A0A1D2M707_ORCCI|nr:hypothetical protein Ocin01_17972 [Orchesella cincta]